MGLLEKAYEYKKELNREGRTTLIDEIIGPAEAEQIGDNADTDIDRNIISVSETIFDAGPQENENNTDVSDKSDLFQLPEDDDSSPIDALNEQKQAIINYEEILSDDNDNPGNSDQRSAQDETNPLTGIDEPVLPKDIDREKPMQNINENESASGMEEKTDIPEIEPEIFPDNDEMTKKVEPENPENNAVPDPHYTGSNDPLTVNESFLQNAVTLNEIIKEITRSETRKTLFEVIIFFMMGQIGATAASILTRDNENNWIISDSSGLKSSDLNIHFNADSGIIKTVRKDIIDVEDFKDNKELLNDYEKMISINSRLLIPWMYKGKVICILSLGNKIIDEEYTGSEKELLNHICEAAAIVLNNINTIEKLTGELTKFKSDLGFLNTISSAEGISGEINISRLKKKIESLFKDLGVISYSVFLNDPVSERYINVVNEDEDFLTFEESGFYIDEKNPFIQHILNNKNNPVIEDFNDSDPVKEAFGDVYRKKMSSLWIFPFEFNNYLIGFTAVYKLKEEISAVDYPEDKRKELLSRVKILTNSIIHILNNLTYLNQSNKYIDNTGYIIKKINKELKNSKALNIPLSLIIFSIKNFKRYSNIFGYDKSRELIYNFLDLIKSKISDTEFFARFSMNKVLLLLPGKDRKYATPFANVIRNEFIQRFKKSEMQLLITFLITEYPEDGDDILSMTENID